MDKLIPIRELNEETRELISVLTLNKNEMKKLTEMLANDMIADKLDELIIKVQEPFLETNYPKNAEGVRELYIFSVRMAYVIGAENALDSYSRAIEMELRERSVL